MQRQARQRIALPVIGLLLSAATNTGWCAADRLTPDDYFLSETNPIATSDQRSVETRSLHLMEAPEVKSARERAIFRWKAAVRKDPPAEAWAMFDAMIEEYVFNYVIKAANSDANYPKVAQIYAPPHEWFGLKVPGGRVAGDNPDNSYRIIPIAGDARYEITGRRLEQGPSDVTFTLVGDYATSKTLSSLEGRDLAVGADGSFTITVDPQPADGRPNHLQSKPSALFLFIRDSRGDWRQLPNALKVRRLDPPSAPPLTDQQMAERAAVPIVDDVPLVFWWMRLGSGGDPNTMTKPFHPAVAAGGLASQVNTNGVMHLSEDDAVVVNVHPAGAAFRDIVLQDYWYRTIDYPHHTSSLNMSQGVPNADGTFTYVISIKDPGVYNWLDTVGLHEVMLQHRWQGLPRVGGGRRPVGSCATVKTAGSVHTDRIFQRRPPNMTVPV
jgi:hypothetical protein